MSSWHSLTADATLAQLHTRTAGLAATDIAPRLQEHGPNSLPEPRTRSAWRMLLDQFTDFMVLVLIAAAVLSGVLGDPADTIAIVVIVVMNAALGFAQEYRAAKAMDALRAMAAPHARVRRDGAVVDLPSAELVPGDVVQLEAGDKVPADVRLIEVAQLRTDEAALTGESQPVEKGVDPLADVVLADRTNMAWSGTLVANGRGTGVVVATGHHTELGRIAALLHGTDAVKTPLQKRLARFGKWLGLVVIALCAVLFGVGLLRGEPVLLMFLTALSLAVAAIPEALPAVVTVALSLGARKMVQNHALVRRLPAVETLGSVTWICSDKTGTLTENKMHVEHVVPALDEDFARALALCNDATPERGDPTELALYAAAVSAGVDPVALRLAWPRQSEVPFDSERARMSTVHEGPKGLVAYVKGAPESVIPRCISRDGDEEIDHVALLADAERMAAEGLRVLAFAVRWLPGPTPEVEEQLDFLGLVGLIDPPRQEAKDAIALCQSAGIHVVMITGDHPATAKAIATRLGIVEPGAEVLTGQDLAKLSDEAFHERVPHVRVYARAAPEQKIRIVKALQARGEFVAMTGDGVNDAPALQRADIGVAMGKGGTDVAREAAAVVLLDDNFATIVGAVREGRRIYDNIRKFVRYALTGNAGEIWALVLAPLIGMPIPLLPIHILWVNLVTDGLPGLALTAEPAERGVMKRPPRPPGENVFAHGLGISAIWVGLLIGGLTLGVQAWALKTGDAHWQSMAFTTLTLSQMALVLAIRSERESFFTIGPFTNLPLLGAVALTFGLQMATLYVPFLQPIFRTQALTLGELGICLGASAIVFVAVELEKWLIRRGWLYRR